ncbi:hypothetical protein CLAVI_000149 [Candidatus Clavichlamydia salmonicola]|uniref:hypothetical protein n=1 Tax=Candidatus Clavichlamydia salmonicola TaxID=469812 RepID=UPI001890F5D1|nr:hypothetical protein [Candidatus Clavichlamydia salmonicola]MBF5050539.1 hypothetical protein [Candidatus Clavichlamydia salmonicola]
MMLKFLHNRLLSQVVSILLSIFSIISLDLQASPAGNPADPILLSYSTWGICTGPLYDTPTILKDYSEYTSPFSMGVKCGFYGDYIFKKKMSIHKVPLYLGDIIKISVPVREMSLSHSGVSFTINFQGNDTEKCLSVWDWEVFGVVGATSMHLSLPLLGFRVPTASDEPNTSTGMMDILTDIGLSYNVGIKKILYRRNDIVMGVSAEYTTAFPKMHQTILFQVDAPEVYFEESPHILRYQDWSTSLSMCTRVNNYCFPYVSIIAGYSIIEPSQPENIFKEFSTAYLDWNFIMRDIESTKILSVACGMSYLVGNNTSVTVEGRWGQQSAIHVDMKVLF